MRNPLERAFNTRFQGFPPMVEITYQVITGFVNQKPLEVLGVSLRPNLPTGTMGGYDEQPR